MLLSYASLLLIAIRDYLTTKVAARLLSLSVTSDVAVCLGRDLHDRRHTYRYQYSPQFHLAIYPTEPECPFVYPQLRLVNNIRLRKPGYLSIRKRYAVPPEHASAPRSGRSAPADALELRHRCQNVRHEGPYAGRSAPEDNA